MPSPKQIVVIVGLATAAGAVWVPQLLNEDDGPPPVSENIPAMAGEVAEFEDGGSAVGAPGTGTSAPIVSAPGPSISVAPEGASEVSQPLPAPTDGGRGSVATTSSGMTQSGDLHSRAGDLLASVSASLAAAEARRSSASISFTSDPQSSFNPEASASLESAREAKALEAEWIEVQDFLEVEPVTAVMMGKGTAMALVGSRIVRPGDLLAGGLLEVRVIGRDGVRYRYRDRDVVQELPAFQAVKASSSSSVGSDSESESESESSTSEAGASESTDSSTTTEAK